MIPYMTKTKLNNPENIAKKNQTESILFAKIEYELNNLISKDPDLLVQFWPRFITDFFAKKPLDCFYSAIAEVKKDTINLQKTNFGYIYIITNLFTSARP